MNSYGLYVKIDGVWTLQCRIDADNHSEAFKKAMIALSPEHYRLPIKLEQGEASAPAK